MELLNIRLARINLMKQTVIYKYLYNGMHGGMYLHQLNRLDRIVSIVHDRARI